MKHVIFSLWMLLLLAGCGGSGSNSQTTTDNDNDTIVVVPDEAENDDKNDIVEPIAEEPAKDWYVRLVATDNARGLETRSALLGELDKADATVEQKLDRSVPFTSSYIDIAFIDPQGLEEGEYKSHFLPYTQNEQMWRFTVLCDDTQAQVTLTWRGLFKLTPYTDESGQLRYTESLNRTNPILTKMQLIDEATGRTVAVINSARPQTISFNMEGSNSRTFRWERKLDDIEIEALDDTKGSVQAQSVSKSISASSLKSEESASDVAEFGTIEPRGFRVPNHQKSGR